MEVTFGYEGGREGGTYLVTRHWRVSRGMVCVRKVTRSTISLIGPGATQGGRGGEGGKEGVLGARSLPVV